MTPEEVKRLEPVGEFGSLAWCEVCANYGAELLRAANLPSDLAWGFSEIYTHAPARLLQNGRQMSAYYIMVKDGEVTGGDGAPEECRALPGFHVAIQWGLICNQSASLYGREGQIQRSADEKVMYEAIEKYVGRPNPLKMARREKPYWPAEVGSALSQYGEEGGGLHNIAATLQAPSPEFKDIPTTELGVPVFDSMNEAQKHTFLELCGVNLT